MSNIFLVSNRVKIKIGLTLATLAGCTLLIANSTPRFAVTSIAEGKLSTSHGQVSNRLEAELITIRSTGFDPAQITRPRGRFILVLNNRSGTHELDLRLDREAGERQLEVRMPRGRLRWKQMIDPPPGNYRLTEANHPDWLCRIIITAR